MMTSRAPLLRKSGGSLGGKLRETGTLRSDSASSGLLPEGFAFDPGWPWLRLIGFGEDVTKKSEEHRQREVLAREMGFADNASLERAKRFAALPESLIGRLKDFFAFQGA